MLKFRDISDGQVKGVSDVYQPITLEDHKSKKLEEIYLLYKQDKEGEVVSSLIGQDGNSIVFEYAELNQADYTKIATKLALNTNLTESIIGSKSHGKFYISRSDMGQLITDFDTHEVSLYEKFVHKRSEIQIATTIEEVQLITW